MGISKQLNSDDQEIDFDDLTLSFWAVKISDARNITLNRFIAKNTTAE